MDDARFLAIINRALRESTVDLAAPASPSDPRAVAAWADFLRRCVARGISIADPRWRDLVLRSTEGRPGLVLASEGRTRAGDAQEDGADFTLGLSLLMSLLGTDADREDC